MNEFNTKEINQLAIEAKTNSDTSDLLWSILEDRTKRIIKAKNFYVSGYEFEDIVQLAGIAFIKAVNSYDMERGDFVPHSTVAMLSEIKMEMTKQNNNRNKSLNGSVSTDSSVKVGNKERESSFNEILTNEDEATKMEGYRSTEFEFFYNKDLDILKDTLRRILPEFNYQVMQLWMQGKTYEDIAEIMGIEKKSVDNYIFNARTKVKSTYNEYGELIEKTVQKMSVAALTVEQRKILNSKSIGMSFEKIAEKLGCSVDEAHITYTKAIEKITPKVS